MARIFTIAEGLQILGALKTGGQGSVYKAKKTDEIITAVKLLPTPIFNESEEDKDYATFQNEVQKLKKVNEEPNPNVVRIIDHGISPSGSLPFIVMEFIEGPDLEELLKPPHDRVFTIKEVIRVAEHLSNALSHCHRLNVKHGDIKSNNVKFNLHSGNYVLLDFGLAVMSDEQRRTSLRQAGAIEFMAPEQSEGAILFQTDVYSFGVVLFELLAGTVPFPLRDKTDTARNLVMLAHLDAPVPDLVTLRKNNLPASWDEEKKLQESYIPDWLVSTIHRCLEKKPEDRFANGVQLHNFIVRNSTAPVTAAVVTGTNARRIQQLEEENRKLVKEKKELEALVLRYQSSQTAAPAPQNYVSEQSAPRNSSSSTLIAFIITAIIVAIIVYFALKDNRPKSIANDPVQQAETPKTPVSFKVAATRAYFHNEPEESTRRSAFIPMNASLEGTDEKNGFVYTEFTNSRGQVSKGWLKRQDLVTLEEWTIAQNNARQREEQVKNQLAQAKNYLDNNQLTEALVIYSDLAAQEVPEAMYQYSDLALTGDHQQLSCEQAISMMERASAKGHAAAKRTLGYLYVFADQRQILSATGHDRCTFTKDVVKGTQLLIQAIRDGDTTARDIMDDISRLREEEEQ
jgi:eukaryotic-like serine/threonine-protein kinase